MKFPFIKTKNDTIDCKCSIQNFSNLLSLLKPMS
jgi:hypothetical protein